ncbi:type II toxin-antitoxin system RelE/ParE family toxin [Massilibacteroides vaginae]|uniref:type II toxin-antitoxin system RelE/ParE family toxin n=1 Tax=Massilibacteroides vaginae TaxID=1673718 RepID=UPI000A1CC4FB|nr:type II toxin-antitoxin system RelE/ParE family toxin [Massilibacteroides vaginae]
MVLIWLSPAKESLKEITDYYKKEYSERAARKIVRQIKTAVMKLKDFPEMAAVEFLLEDEPLIYRSLVVTSTYKVVYYIGSDVIYVYDIWDCRQSPETNKRKSKK